MSEHFVSCACDSSKIDKLKEYRTKNKVFINNQDKKRHQKNKIRDNQYSKECRLCKKINITEKEKQSRLNQCRIGYKENKGREPIKARARYLRAERKLYKNNTSYRLKGNLRGRLNTALKKQKKVGSHILDLGCSIEELKFRFEFFWPQFKWEEHGKIWTIDHIIPLSIFDLTNIEQLKIAVNFINLQPLLPSENSSKGNKLNIQCKKIIKSWREREIAGFSVLV